MMNDLKVDFPFKLEDLMKYTFNFDNLIKAISILHNNNMTLYLNFNEFNKRISLLENLKNDIEDVKIQATQIQNENNNINRSLQIMQERFLKVDGQINELNQKIAGNKSNIEEHGKMLQMHCNNLDHLNKVVEENIKKTNSVSDDLDHTKKEVSIINEKIDDLKKKDKDLEDLIQMKNELLNTRIDENKKDIAKINNNIDELNSALIDLRNEINIKNQEFESSIANIINNLSINNLNDLNLKKTINMQKDDDNTGLLIKTVNDNILLSSKIAQIEAEEKHFKEFITKYNSDKDNYNDNIDKNSNEIENLHKELENIKIEIELLASDENNKTKQSMKNIDLNNFVTLDMFKKINDNIRILSSSFGTTPTREEFETTLKKINSRLETIEFIQQGVTSGPRTMINSDLVQKGEKTTYITQAQKIVLPLKDDGKSINVDEIKKLIITTINEEIKNISLLENPKFTEIFQNINKCEEEISKNDSSIINIRNILAVSPTQNDLMLLKQDIERLSEESKKKFNEIIHNLNGDEEEESEEDDNKSALAGFCIKKKIEILIGKYQELFSKLTSVQNKNNTLNREIKEEVKQNLKNETLRVVDDFKSKLENFTAKFEIELKNKIDRGGLSIFEDKLNSRIKGDLKEKLDRIELKKNNYVIKRKIDSLENKISKTLVDTIIDLQMDEAPLLMKKNANNYEQCASCNQPIKKTNFLNTDRNFYKSSNSIKNNAGKHSHRNHSNISNALNANMNLTNYNSNYINNNNKKLPGISSYMQSK